MARQVAENERIVRAALLAAAFLLTATAAGQGLTLTLPGDVPLALVRVPAGTFTMGSADSERGRDRDEGPLRDVTLTTDLHVGVNVVTQAQWVSLMGSNPAVAWGYGVGPDYPVYAVSWEDIAGPGGFLERLNAHLVATGQPGAGLADLPTEAEWERAARGGTSTRYSFGDALECDDACVPCPTAERYVWWCVNNDPFGSKPVGRKRPNPYGLYDVHGNVLEWVRDWYGPYPVGPRTDPIGPEAGTYRVLRGGYWRLNLSYCRSANRGAGVPDAPDPDAGFRIVVRGWSGRPSRAVRSAGSGRSVVRR